MQTMPNDQPLRSALRQNAVFSGLSGLFFLAIPGQVATFLGFGPSWLFAGLGVGLLLFSADLFHQASRVRLSTIRALLASVADFLWVAGTALLLLFWHGMVTGPGILAMIAVALVVLQFGLRQARGLSGLYRDADKSDCHFYQFSSGVQAPPEAIWPVIADLGRISKYASNLAHSRLIGPTDYGRGARRECVDNQGKSWTEECVAFKENSHLTLLFDTNSPDFPFPASDMTGGWQVTAEGDGARVTVWWRLRVKPRWAAFAIMPALAWQVEKDFPALLANMDDAARERHHEQHDILTPSKAAPHE